MGVPIPLQQEPDNYGIGKADAQVFTPTAANEESDLLQHKALLRMEQEQADKKQQERDQEQEKRAFQHEMLQLNPKNVPAEWQAPMQDEANGIIRDSTERFTKDKVNPMYDPDIRARMNSFTQKAAALNQHQNYSNYIDKQIAKKGVNFYTQESLQKRNNRYIKEDGTHMSPEEGLQMNQDDYLPEEKIDMTKEWGGMKLKVPTKQVRVGNEIQTQADIPQYNGMIARTLESPRAMLHLKQNGFKFENASPFIIHDPSRGYVPIDPNNEREVNGVADALASHPDLNTSGIDSSTPENKQKLRDFVKEQAGKLNDYYSKAKNDVGVNPLRIKTDLAEKKFDYQRSIDEKRLDLSRARLAISRAHEGRESSKFLQDDNGSNAREEIGKIQSGDPHAISRFENTMHASQTDYQKNADGTYNITIPNNSGGYDITKVDPKDPDASPLIHSLLYRPKGATQFFKKPKTHSQVVDGVAHDVPTQSKNSTFKYIKNKSVFD